MITVKTNEREVIQVSSLLNGVTANVDKRERIRHNVGGSGLWKPDTAREEDYESR